MTKAELAMNANPVVAFLQKPTEEFTKADIIRFIEANEVKMVNFMYPADDGKLKTLNFVITNRDYLETILTCGERVDGSSLFSFIEAGSSDLYVLPRFSTAFLDPFAEIPTLCMLCKKISLNSWNSLINSLLSINCLRCELKILRSFSVLCLGMKCMSRQLSVDIVILYLMSMR